jgi:hypothetical protein
MHGRNVKAWKALKGFLPVFRPSDPLPTIVSGECVRIVLRGDVTGCLWGRSNVPQSTEARLPALSNPIQSREEDLGRRRLKFRGSANNPAAGISRIFGWPLEDCDWVDQGCACYTTSVFMHQERSSMTISFYKDQAFVTTVHAMQDNA